MLKFALREQTVSAWKRKSRECKVPVTLQQKHLITGNLVGRFSHEGIWSFMTPLVRCVITIRRNSLIICISDGMLILPFVCVSTRKQSSISVAGHYIDLKINQAKFRRRISAACVFNMKTSFQSYPVVQIVWKGPLEKMRKCSQVICL